MKLAIIASIWISNPPKGFGFGAQEYLTYHIAERMKKKGHDVTLFASGDSKVSTGLRSVIDKQVMDLDFPDRKIKDIIELMNVSECYKHAEEFDMIHNHLLPYGLLFAEWSKTPTIHTLHHTVYRDHADIFLYERYKSQNYISISNMQQSIMPELNYMGTVYNGIDTDFYTFRDCPQPSPSPYILYIGRLKKYKGIHTAIRLARELNILIKIAAPLPHVSQPDFQEVNQYWEEEISPLIGPGVEHIDTIEGKKKVALLQNAKCLIFPVERQEPFGMTLIEAMACGTPVIAYAKGSVPEIVKDGETGFIVNSSPTDIRGDWIIKKTGIEGLCEAVERVYSMPQEKYLAIRKACRAHVQKHFTVERMVQDYEKVYLQMLNHT